jgi:hypothetical protein
VIHCRMLGRAAGAFRENAAMSTEGMIREIGVGLISVGWMGRLHTRSYKAVAEHYPELGLNLRLNLGLGVMRLS